MMLSTELPTTLLHALLEASQEAVVLLNAKREMLNANGLFLDMTNQNSLEAIQQQPLNTLLGKGKGTKELETLLQQAASGQEAQNTFWLQCMHQDLYCQVKAFALPLKGEAPGMVIMLNDQTPAQQPNKSLKDYPIPYQIYFDTTPQPVLLLDNALRFVTANKVGRQYIRTATGTELRKGDPFTSILPLAQQQRTHQRLLRAFEQGQRLQLTAAVLGDELVGVQFEPVESTAGHTSLATLTINPVLTGIKQASQIEQMTLLAERLDEAFLVIDGKGCIQWTNQGFAQATGYPLEKAKGKSLAGLLKGPRTAQETLQQLKKHWHTAEAFTCEVQFYKANKDPLWMSLDVRPVKDNTNTLEGYVCLAKDITAAKMAKEQLAVLNYKLKSLLDSSVQCYVMLSANMEVMEFNKVANDMSTTLWGRDLVKDANLLSYFNPIQAKQFARNFRQAMQGEPVIYEARLGMPNEKQCWFELSFLPIRDGNGHVFAVSFGALDITPRKLSELHMMELNDSLQREIEERRWVEQDLVFKNNELDTFIYKASHDLRGPISRMLGLAYLAQKECNDPTMENYINMMHNTAQRMDEVLRALIGLSEIKDQPLAITKLQLSQLVNDVLMMMEDKVQAVKPLLNLRIDDELLVMSDAGLLIVMLKNLLENALHYGRRNQRLHLAVKACRDDDGFLHLLVSDNGCGIAPEIHEKVFNMFFKSHPESTGSGLGLYMVRSAVERLKGRINLQSAEGKGSSFHICLPPQAAEIAGGLVSPSAEVREMPLKLAYM